MFDITVKGGQVIVGESVLNVMRELQEWEIENQEKKNQAEELRAALYEAMKKANIKKWDYQDESLGVTVSRIDEQVRRTVDTNALKEAGLYEAFTKSTVTAPSVRIKYR